MNVDLRGCSLAYGPNDEHRCEWCGEALTGRRTRWCSDECPRAALDQHAWTNARAAALRRDVYTCTRCIGWPHLPQPQRLDFGADHNAYLVAVARWRREVTARQLEVNHVKPRNGEGYGPGCHHHLDNLETLCHPHHVAETNHQRRLRCTSGREVTVQQQVLVA